MSYDDKIKPQTFIKPNFTPDAYSHAQREWLQKSAQNTKKLGDQGNLLESRRQGNFRSYDEFTKQFDKSELNTYLREPYFYKV